jgi:uncharacterized protein YqfA (UPF0365 family)
MSRNEAAVRLLTGYWSPHTGEVQRLVKQALAAERRATVDEFYERLEALGFAGAHLVRDAMLDEEAAR